MKMKMITHILWACIFILTILIGIRLLQRESLPEGLNNVKEVLTEKTLPALEQTKKDIFPEERQTQHDNIAKERF